METKNVRVIFANFAVENSIFLHVEYSSTNPIGNGSTTLTVLPIIIDKETMIET